MATPNWNALYSNQGIRFSGNPALDELRQTYATQQAQKQKDNDAFTAQIAKLNFGGAKDADLPALQKKYNDILGTFSKLRNTNDHNERMQLGLELQQLQNGFIYDAEKSKLHNQSEMKDADLVNNQNNNISDSFHENWGAMNKTSSFDPQYEAKVAAFKNNMFDKSYDVEGTTKKLFDNVTHDASKSDVIQKEKGGGERVVSTKATATDKNDFINSVINKAKSDKNYLHNIVKATGIEDPAQALHTYAEKAYETYNKDNNTIQKLGAVQNKPDLYYAHRDYEVTHPIGNQTPNTPTYIQDLSDRFSKDPYGQPLDELSSKFAANPLFNHGLGIVKNPNGTVTINVPAKYKYDAKLVQKDENGNVIPNTGRVATQSAYKVTINPKDKLETRIKIGDIFKQATGDNTGEPAKVLTPAGKGHVGESVTKLPKQVSSQQEYDALPKGAQYIAPNGQVYIKK